LPAPGVRTSAHALAGLTHGLPVFPTAVTGFSVRATENPIGRPSLPRRQPRNRISTAAEKSNSATRPAPATTHFEEFTQNFQEYDLEL